MYVMRGVDLAVIALLRVAKPFSCGRETESVHELTKRARRRRQLMERARARAWRFHVEGGSNLFKREAGWLAITYPFWGPPDRRLRRSYKI